jgi:hypothetical protein
MAKDNRKIRVQFARCPNEPQGDDPHWLLVEWTAPASGTICRFHPNHVQVRFKEPLKRGLVTPEEYQKGWATVLPDPYDEIRWRELNGN